MPQPNAGEQYEIIKRCRECGTEYPVSYEPDTCRHDGAGLVLSDADKMIGSVVAARYQIESQLGSGGWSSVYQARDLDLNRPVAIKLLHEYFKSDDVRVKRFQREAQMSSGLNHPQITIVHDFGLLPSGQPFIVMELLQGQSLDTVLDHEKRLSVKRTLNIVSQICDALETAHAGGIIHRDLKPGNIFLLVGDFVKVLDFGLAKSLNGAESLTTSGHTIGTPGYMSPEQCRGEQLDARSDIYSLGLLMHEMLTGERLFESATLFESMHRHIAEKPQSLSQAAADLYFPPALESIVLRCLEKDRDARFADCSQLKDAIQQAVAGNLSALQQMVVQTSTSRAAGRRKMVLTAGVGVALAGALAAAVTLQSLPGVKPAAPGAPAAAGTDQATDPGAGRRGNSGSRRGRHGPDGHGMNEPPPSETGAPRPQMGVVLPGRERFIAHYLRSNADAEQALVRAPDTRGITVSHSDVDDGLVKHIVSRYPGVRHLNFEDTKVSNAVCSVLVGSDVSALSLGRTRVTDAGLPALARLSSLKYLDLADNRITDAGVAQLADRPLRTLVLRGTAITPASGKALGTLTSISALSLARTNFDDSGMQALRQLPSLTALDLSHTKITDGAAAALTSLPSLRELSLAHTGITDATVAELSKCAGLRALDLSYTKITPNAVALLINTPNLEEVRLGPGEPSGELLLTLRKANIELLPADEGMFSNQGHRRDGERRARAED